MSFKLFCQKEKIITLLSGSLLLVGMSEFVLHQAYAEFNWEPISTPKKLPPNLIWKPTPSDSRESDKSPVDWEVVPKSSNHNEHPSKVVWEVVETKDEMLIPISQTSSNSIFTTPSSLEEAEALLRIIPPKPSDYQTQLRLSPLVSTAETLPKEQWRIAFETISFFDSNADTSHQNYSANLDIGLNNRLLLTFFVSQADEPLNVKLSGFASQPESFWQSYGTAALWQVMDQDNWKLAIGGSLEGWEVGSGGGSSTRGTEANASPNIFNKSGSRVFTHNIVGSLRLPFSWRLSNQWQFSFSPGLSFLPATQGAGQGGAGTFYGTNSYVSGGVLFQPFPELGLMASLAKPIGSGNNSFNADLEFSRVPIYSASINWNLNPRIGLKGLITNGFGTTPATAILTLPSDNRLGYSASFVYTPDAVDTPQVELTPRQKTLAKGGMTVNTALIPPDKTTVTWINFASSNDINYFIGHSISNALQINLYSSSPYTTLPQNSEYDLNYASDATWNWRVGGKAIAFSPLRGAPFWGSGYISLGRSIEDEKEKIPRYLFAETMASLELSNNLAVNLNPKLAWSGIGSLWGVGLSSNIQLAPNLELIPEANVVLNKMAQSNATLGLRWNATERFSIDIYASTAASILDIGQLISADEVRLGARMQYTF